MGSLDDFVKRIRLEQGLDREVPGFDPKNGNESAKFLFVLEAPGAKAVNTGFISFENPDQTAANFRYQFQEAGVMQSEIAIWNIVPWYLGNSDQTKIRAARSKDVRQCLAYLGDLVLLLEKLEAIVLVGTAARKAHIFLSAKTDVRILSCHHPSPKVKNFSPETTHENVEVMKAMLSYSRRNTQVDS